MISLLRIQVSGCRALLLHIYWQLWSYNVTSASSQPCFVQTPMQFFQFQSHDICAEERTACQHVWRLAQPLGTGTFCKLYARSPRTYRNTDHTIAFGSISTVLLYICNGLSNGWWTGTRIRCLATARFHWDSTNTAETEIVVCDAMLVVNDPTVFSSIRLAITLVKSSLCCRGAAYWSGSYAENSGNSGAKWIELGFIVLNAWFVFRQVFQGICTAQDVDCIIAYDLGSLYIAWNMRVQAPCCVSISSSCCVTRICG